MAILLKPKRNSGQAQTVALVTLRDGVVFPHTEAILSFGRQSSVAGVKYAADSDRMLIIATQKNQAVIPTLADLYTTATLCQVVKVVPVNNELHAIVKGIVRVKIHDVSVENQVLFATISQLDETAEESDELKAMVNHLIAQIKKAVNLGKSNIEVPLFMRLISTSSAPAVTDQIASVLDVPTKEKQKLLEELDLSIRINQVMKHLDHEINVLQLERKIATKTQNKFDKSMKETVLRERMKTIQKELGENEEDNEITELKKKIKKIKPPLAAKKKIFKELNRLEKTSVHNPEGGYIRTWLETMIEIPWNKFSKNNISLTQAADVLKHDHYGLEEVKERILEYLAVMQLKKKRDAKAVVPTIICFVGPPGVGKTSVGRSIANALGRRFAKVSLGGIHDEAAIRGHRRTYVGAMPGRITQSLIDASTSNPVIMLDEIDKIGTDYRGDPSSALLEVLDPEQNHAFTDHYLDTPIDLSRVMFITTANILDTVPPALKDRLEIIHFSGYTEDEKYHIALNHLIDKQLNANGLTAKDVFITHPALKNVIKHYTHEAGVRNLEREIAKMLRKTARKIAQAEKDRKSAVKITPKGVSRLLGPRKFTHTLADDTDQVGISTGLAYTSAGGDILFIEVALMEGKGRINITGQLGDVMKESAQAALSYVRAHAKDLNIVPGRFAKTDVHIHVPEGATPKDGPSAGAAITTALVSAFTRRPINRLIGMTGEISLRGRVMEIGGIKEKIIAGHRAGLKQIVLPKDNQKDLVKVPSKVKKDLKLHFVSHLDDVLKLALKK